MKRECKLVPHVAIFVTGKSTTLPQYFLHLSTIKFKKDALHWSKYIILNSGVNSNLSYGGQKSDG